MPAPTSALNDAKAVHKPLFFFLNWKIFGECPALLKHGDKIEYSVILEGLLELEMPRTQVTEDSVLLKATWEQEQLHRRLTQEDHLSPGVSV